jgi:hypothetical protein
MCSSKKSIGASTTTSTFYMIDNNEKIICSGLNKIKIKTKKSMKSILDVKSKEIVNLSIIYLM